MACRFSELVVDSRGPEGLAASGRPFWTTASCREEGAAEIGPGAGFGGAAPTLVFTPVPDPTPGKVRLHIDLSPTDRDQDEEPDRLLGLGATRADVGQRGDEGWHVLADPEGNQFCLLRRQRLGPA
jgi:hypothetical protein